MDMLVHELKTPIAVVRISLDTLAENTRPIQRSLRALENMTQILDRSASSLWIEHGAFQPSPETFTLNTLIRELLASTPDAERVDYQVSQSDRVMTDRMLLRTVLSNLVENALKYSPSQSPVTLSQRGHTPQRQHGVLITVRNQSNDLAGLDPQAVFEKFYRGPAARGRSGSGLGLYICQEIVRILGGTIQCHIEQDTIRVDLWIPRSISS
jgi:signal transduction histidine kinase